ncbi:MAG: tRNA (uridine(34)/cytosine(34)/5-carboxymethylaminomethyluridine(34)-2'-O)-methyltransferase TrmL [Gammaproteobacteria bacterium]|nr:tRNA (uridine(34)/cytosine(34)/5-carboxymethylaminomethyluridine(34)-2'-O)-methyltransferase TrmL [Gammaproteobacteria bacterium]
MFHIILYEPEIPPNTGNIIRLCANTGNQLHLIHPLGFNINDKQLRRAGLDYREFANVEEHNSLDACQAKLKLSRLFAVSTKGKSRYSEQQYREGDAFLFGPETRGLPDDVLNLFSKEQSLTIPMQAESRSLNLSNAVAILVYEAWRQNNFTKI